MTATLEIQGVQTPSFYRIPSYADNAYEEAVDLSAAYGLIPDKWQAYCLRAMLGERPDGRWAGTRVGISVPRQNGKNAIIEMRELFGLVILGERILHTAHEVKTSMEHFIRMKEDFFDNDECPDLKKMVRRISNKNGEEGIYLKNGGVLKFLARSKGSGRGFSADVIVFDEAQELEEQKQSAVLYTVSASPNRQIIYLGTPPGPNVNGDIFTNMREEAEKNESERLVWLEWSAGDEDDPHDVASWAKSNPGLGIRLLEETILDETHSSSDEEFRRERLGQWGGKAAPTVIDMGLWATLKSDANPEDPVAFAIDVSPNRDRASISVAGYVGEHIHMQVIENKAGTGWIVEKIKDLKEKYGPCAIMLDKAGPAASLLPDLKAARIKVMTTGPQEMAQACGAFYDGVQQERYFHANQTALNDALQQARKRKLNDAWAWNRKNLEADITPLVAVTLAAYALSIKRKPKGQREKARVVVM